MNETHRRTSTTAGKALVEARIHALDRSTAQAHDLEHVAEVDGVNYINDSKATFLDATLRSLDRVQGPVIWISGCLPVELGSGGPHDLLRNKVVAVVLFGTEAERNLDALDPFVEHVYFALEVRTACFLARELARQGETVLFSPGCPSGEGYANYEERGMAFKQAVRDL
ncbi:MAG: hypothetical protein KDB88_05545 [Flavobacteriales bacterium]|nr:hypothetical protein [Flavobacteriales bacterium]